MKPTCRALPLVSAAVAVLVFAGTRIVRAGGADCSLPEFKKSYASGQQADKAGKTTNALLYYDYAGMCLPEAASALKSLVRRLAADAEKAGRLDAEAVFRGTPDATCRKLMEADKDPEIPGLCSGDQRMDFNPNAGAVQLYERIFAYADADRVRVAMVRQSPADTRLFDREKSSLESHRDDPPEDYPKKAPYLDEMKKIAGDRGAKPFGDEPAQWARNEMDVMGGGTRGQRSLMLLTQAKQWWEFFSDPRLKDCKARAEAHGDELGKDQHNPNNLTEAIAMYNLFGNDAKIAAVKASAKKLGDAAAKAGDSMNAAQYYSVAGDEKAAREVSKGMADEALKNVKSGKGLPQMNDAEKQKKFKKETQDLEKELGF